MRITEALQPRAQMVNMGTAQPGGYERSSLHAVAAALSSLSSDLASVGEKQMAQEREANALRAEADFWTNNSEGAAEAVRQGTIPPNASPGYMQGYGRAAGSAAGFQLEQKVGAAYETWDGRQADGTTADPTKFDAWFRSTVKDHVKTNDPNYLRGLLPHVREIQNRYSDRWRKDVAANTLYKAESNYGALAGSTIDEYSREGIINKSGTDVEKLGATLDAIRDNAYKSGMRQENIDKLMVDAITTKAISQRDPNLLKLLDRDSITGKKFADTPYGRDQKLKTEETLTSLYKSQMAEERTRQDRADKKEMTTAKAAIVNEIIKNPEGPLNEDLIKRVETLGDPDFRINILNWKKMVREGNTAEDPLAVSEVYNKILNGGGIDAVTGAMLSGTIKQPSTIASAIGFLKSAEDYAQSDSKILANVSAKTYMKEIETRGLDQKLSANGILGQIALTPEGRQARNGFTRDLIEWQLQNPKAPAAEREKMIETIGEKYLKALGQPVVPNASPAQGPPASTPAPTPQGAPQGAPGASSPNLPSLTPEQTKQLQDRAKQLGVDPQEYIKRFQQQMQPQPGGTGQRSSIQLPNGQTLDVPGLSPDAAKAIQNAMQQQQGGGQQPSLQRAAYTQETGSAPQGGGDPNVFQAEGLKINYVGDTSRTYGRAATANAKPFNALVAHHTATETLDQALNTLKGDSSRGGSSFGYHFYIDKDGTITQGVPLSARTNHVKGPFQSARSSREDIANENAIGVAFVGSDSDKVTPAQLEAAQKLSQSLVQKYNIPLNNIVGHGEIQSDRQGREGMTLVEAMRKAGPTGSKPVQAQGGVQGTVASMLKAGGLSPVAIAAALGHAEQESSFKADASNGKTFGLWQWLGPRREALEAFAKSAGGSPADPKVQTAFFLHELKTSESKAGEMLRNARTPEQAHAAMRAFERYGDDGSDDKRLGNTKKWLSQLASL